MCVSCRPSEVLMMSLPPPGYGIAQGPLPALGSGSQNKLTPGATETGQQPNYRAVCTTEDDEM